MKQATDDESSLIGFAVSQAIEDLCKKIHLDCPCPDCEDDRELRAGLRKLRKKLLSHNIGFEPKVKS